MRGPRRISVAAGAALLCASCTFFEDATTRLPGPRLYEHGAAVIGQIRAFESRIGFKPTDNFRDLSRDTESYPFCGYVSRYRLPYSYEDPVIHWADLQTEAECRETAGDGMDVYFGQTEAVGEEGTPVTTSMLAGTLVRFVYLVIHEDCHDQFALPQGVEEPLCNLIAYNAMVEYAAERGPSALLERVAMRRYAQLESERTRQAKAHYEELERLYRHYRNGAIGGDALLEQRAAIFRRAEPALGWPAGTLNNVSLANDITYSRHFPYLESVFIALGRDLGRTVAFFRKADVAKPLRATVMERLGLRNDESIEFIRAYEEATLETVRVELRRELAARPLAK